MSAHLKLFVVLDLVPVMKPSNNRSGVGENWAMEYQWSVRVLTNGRFCGKCRCETINLSVKDKENPSPTPEFFYGGWMKNETTRNWLQEQQKKMLASPRPRISNFWPPKGAIKQKKSKAHPRRHPPPQRSHKLCLGVQFLLFLGSLQKVSPSLSSILTEWDDIPLALLFYCGDRLLF